jgi:hypothetical protein
MLPTLVLLLELLLARSPKSASAIATNATSTPNTAKKHVMTSGGSGAILCVRSTTF